MAQNYYRNPRLEKKFPDLLVLTTPARSRNTNKTDVLQNQPTEAKEPHCTPPEQVYVSGGRPLFILNEAQKEEVIAQAESYLKTAKGRGYRRQVTRAEVIQLLSGLSRDEARTVSFHDAQRAITEYRKRQIARFRVMFPDLVTWGEEKSSLCSVKASNTYAPPSSSSELISRGSGVTRHDGQFTPVATVTKTAGECATVRGAEVQSGRKNGRSGRRAKLSADVAPAEMFLRDVGYTPAGMAKHVSLLFEAAPLFGASYPSVCCYAISDDANNAEV